MKKTLIIACAISFSAGPAYAEEDADTLRAQLEATQQHLREQEQETQTLQVQFKEILQQSEEYQNQADRRARLIEVLKNALDASAAIDDEILEIELPDE